MSAAKDGAMAGPVFQHLLREEDAAGLDPADLIAEAKLAGAGSYLSMGGGFSAWYPTALRSQRPNPHMSGDFLGGVAGVARAAGMKLIARVDLSKGRPEWVARDPDWFVRAPDGTHPTVWDMPQTCPTGPYWQDEAFAIVGEIMAGYRPDGLFFNYLHVPRCHCPRCAATVRAATGASVPAPGTRSPAYEAWRRAFLAAYFRRLGDHARSLRRDVAMIPYHHVRDGWDMRAMAAASDAIASQISNPVVVNPVDPQPQWAHWAAEEAMLARALKPGTAPLLVQTASGFFASRQTAMPPDRMLRNMAEADAHGARIVVAVSGRLDGDDRRALPAVRALGRLAATSAPWQGMSRSMARIAILRSQASIDWGDDDARPSGRADGWGHVGEMRGVHAALARLRHQADILPAEGLEAKALAPYAVAIAPALSCLSDADAAVLDAFVAAGGTLVATGAFGAADADGLTRRTAPCAALPALPGSARRLAGAYLEADMPALRARLGGAPHMGAEGPLWCPILAPADGWSIGLRAIGPFRNNAPEFAIVRGPGTDPGLLRRGHGAGHAVWLPWMPGAAFRLYGIDDHAAVLAEIVEPAAGPPPIETDAPAAVSFLLSSIPEGVLLHVFNDATVQDRPLTTCAPLAGFEVAIACAAVRATDADSGEPLDLARDATRCRIAIDRLGTFRRIVLTC